MNKDFIFRIIKTFKNLAVALVAAGLSAVMNISKLKGGEEDE